MLDADDNAVIMDFGLARTNDGANLTRTGAIMGTVAYMAPEQARGESVDQRADIYAWGLMFYDALVGRRRSGRDPMSELLSRMQEPPPSVRTFEPQVPEALEAIIARSIEPQADRRFATTLDLIAALDALDAEGFATHAAQGKAPAAGAGSKRTALLAAAVLALAVLSGGAWWLSRREQPAAVAAQREPISVLVSDFVN